MMTCADLEELVADRIDKSAPGRKGEALRSPMHGCASCRELVAAYRGPLLVAKRAFDHQGATAKAPEDLVQRILASLAR